MKEKNENQEKKTPVKISLVQALLIFMTCVAIALLELYFIYN